MAISTWGLFYAMEKLQNRQKTVLHAQSALKLFWGVSSTQNEPETYLQHHHAIKFEASKVLLKFERIHLIFGTQLLRFGGAKNQVDILEFRKHFRGFNFSRMVML